MNIFSLVQAMRGGPQTRQRDKSTDRRSAISFGQVWITTKCLGNYVIYLPIMFIHCTD